MLYEVITVYKNSPVEKELYIVPGAGHAEAYRVNPEQYEKVVARVIGRFVN